MRFVLMSRDHSSQSDELVAGRRVRCQHGEGYVVVVKGFSGNLQVDLSPWSKRTDLLEDS